MRKKILLLTGGLLFGIINAQVGINTKNPIGIFHVDGQGDTSGTNSVIDDVIITNSGNIGIGTSTPSAKVTI